MNTRSLGATWLSLIETEWERVKQDRAVCGRRGHQRFTPIKYKSAHVSFHKFGYLIYTTFLIKKKLNY